MLAKILWKIHPTAKSLSFSKKFPVYVNQLIKGGVTFSLLNMQGQEMYKWEKREMFLSASQETLNLPGHLRGSFLLLMQSNQEKAAMPVFIH